MPPQKYVGISMSASGREAASINKYKDISDPEGGAHSQLQGQQRRAFQNVKQ